MKDFVFLSVTNSRYIPITENLIKSLNYYHPNIDLHLVCVNTTNDEIDYMKSLHKNLYPIIATEEFESEDHEKGYCCWCRTWNILNVMLSKNKNVFYLDADIFLTGSIEELFPYLNEAGIMVRAKNSNPQEYRGNNGMIWIKNTPLNHKIIIDWIHKTRAKGKIWLAEQLALNEIVRENWDKINYKDFPKKFNGISTNKESVIIHMKGPKNL